MTDREFKNKVIQGLEHCTANDNKCRGCSYVGEKECATVLKLDALKVLKLTTTPYVEDGGAFRYFACGECGTSIRDNDKYCRECGRLVVWS